jgi:hypothetical protein
VLSYKEAIVREGGVRCVRAQDRSRRPGRRLGPGASRRWLRAQSARGLARRGPALLTAGDCGSRAP